MIKNPVVIIFVLLSVEILILYLSGHRRFERYFRFLPFVFWIYFVPMMVSTSGLIDSQSPILQTISTYLLPCSLFLLLLSVDVKAILRLGRMAIMMFLAGSLGIMLGVPLVFFIFKRWVGDQMWSSFGALSASWIGGSANLIAVKEALGAPDQIFIPVVVVDTVVPYFWMGFLVSLSGLQALYDKWNRSNRKIIDEISDRMKNEQGKNERRLSWDKTIFILGVAMLGGVAAQFFARFLPTVNNAVTTYTWVILIASLLGIFFSLTPVRRLEEFGASRIGYFLLFFVLTSLGARANISGLKSTLILVIAGLLIVLFHMVILIIAARLLKAPMFLVATASQANIGGVASGPIVAEIYQKGLTSVGLLMAILGNITGTYLGILVGQICRWITQM